MKSQKYSILIFFILMFAVAILENVIGVVVPQFKMFFDLSASGVSLVFSVSSLAYISGTYISGKLIPKLGYQRSELLSIGLIILGCLLMTVSLTYLVFVMGLVFINLGIAINGVVLNVTLPELTGDSNNATVMINRLHFMYGLGAMVSKSIAGWRVSQGTTYQHLYLWIGIVFLILINLLLKMQFPNDMPTQVQLNATQSLKKELSDNPPLTFDWKAVLLSLALGSYLFAEVGLSNWLVNYLKEGLGISEAFGGNLLAVFYLFLALGRLYGGKVVNYLGYFPTIISGGVIGSSLVALGLFLQGNGYYLISIAGLFYSIIFPTVVLLISKYYPSMSSTMTSRILTFTFLINMGFNLIFGSMVDQWGFRCSIYLIPLSGVMAMIIFSIFSWLYPIKQIKEPLQN